MLPAPQTGESHADLDLRRARETPQSSWPRTRQQVDSKRSSGWCGLMGETDSHIGSWIHSANTWEPAVHQFASLPSGSRSWLEPHGELGAWVLIPLCSFSLVGTFSPCEARRPLATGGGNTASIIAQVRGDTAKTQASSLVISVVPSLSLLVSNN